MVLTTGRIEKDVEVCSLHPKRRRCFRETNLDKIFTWVDASYVVHHDMKSQDGSVVSMVLIVIHCRSSKQKLNMKSLMEARLVGAGDYVPYNI